MADLILPSLLEGDPFEADAPTLARALMGAVPPQVRPGLVEAVDVLAVEGAHVLASPVSARVGGWGVTEGLRAVHHELRCAPPLGEEQLPELEVWQDDRPQPRWRDGALLVPKYFSAFLDAPLPTFDPNLRTKWRPHEILHRLVGFFWRPDMSRFEFYLGARLGELLPVVHWYGLDEIGRPSGAHRRPTTPGRKLCARSEAEVRPYWEVDDVDEAAGQFHAAHALEHLATELEACRRELDTGRVHATPRPGLDASSDAVGYLRGHWNRVTSWSFGAWVERFARRGVDHFDTVAAFVQRVEDCFCRMVAGRIDVDVGHGLQQAARRDVSDLSYRALCLIELADSDEAEDAILPAVDAGADLTRSSALGDEDVARWRDELERAVATVVRTQDASAVIATGSVGLPIARASIDQVCAGLRSALPRSTTEFDDAQLWAWVEPFVQHPSFRAAKPIGRRFADFAAQHDEVPSTTSQAVDLESWLLEPPRLDEEAERFAVLPRRGARGRWRPNDTLRRRVFEAAAVNSVLDGFDILGSVELVACHYGGEPRVIECDADVRSALESSRGEGAWLQDDETTVALLGSGFLVFFPRVR